MMIAILALNIKNIASDKVVELLSEQDICVRGGLQCAPLAHRKLNTEKTGVVRLSPSIFTKKIQIDFTINSLIEIAK